MTKEIIKNIFQHKINKIIIATTLIFAISFPLFFINYILPTFEKTIMENIVNQAQKISNFVFIEYKKDQSLEKIDILSKSLDVYKIKLFDKNGKALYSSNKNEIGKINTNPIFHNYVSKGNTYYHIVQKGQENVEYKKFTLDIAEIYIPIMENDKFVNAFEVYVNVTKELKKINSVLLKMRIINIMITLLICTIIFLILYFISRDKIKDNISKEKIYKSKKLASMGEMIGNIAHQWRQPLSLISTSVTSMQIQKQTNTLSDEKFNYICDNINKSAQHLSKTIDVFKDYIRNENILERFNLSENINDFINIIDLEKEQNKIHLILNLDDNINIKTYPNELIQSYINLFYNSKDAFIENDIKDKYLFISTYIENNYAHISFQDNAKGISNNIINKIFEPYFTTKHKSQGTGLGLNMTYKLIVDNMKGTIDVTNTKFEYNNTTYSGALFIISIPLS